MIALKKNIKKNVKAAQSYLAPNQIGYLILYVTNVCNFRCNFCFYGEEIDKGKKPDQLSVDELIRISETTGPLLQLSMTGGEPFLRNEFAEITRAFIKNAYAKYVSIPSNGSLTARMVRYLEEILPEFPDTYFRLAFSIEGIGEEHDTIRSMPGSYEKIKESYKAISPLRKRFPNLVLDASSVYTTRSESTLMDTVRELNENFDFDNISINYARGEMKDPGLKEASRENYIKINDYLENIRRRKENRFMYPPVRGVRDVSRRVLIDTVFDDKFVLPCVAGRKLVVISETGEVLPCEVLGKSMGNLRDYDFDVRALLKAEENKKLQKWIKDSKCKCSFECALAANVVWNGAAYPKLAWSALKNIGK